jgi:hypothetical protein
VQSFSKLGIAKSAKSGGGKQLICRLIQMPFGSRHVSKMSNEFSGQFVYVDASKIVELFTPKAENTRAADDRDVDALAVEDVSIHGNPIPLRLPPETKKRAAGS